MVGRLAGLILGLATAGFGIFQLVAPDASARIDSGFHRMAHRVVPSFYEVPLMKRRLDPGWQRRAARPYGAVFLIVGLVIIGNVVLASIAD
jgi:hypothetical protein